MPSASSKTLAFGFSWVDHQSQNCEGLTGIYSRLGAAAILTLVDESAPELGGKPYLNMNLSTVNTLKTLHSEEEDDY